MKACLSILFMFYFASCNTSNKAKEKSSLTTMKESIREAVRSRQKDFATCYKKALSNKPDLKGNVYFDIFISQKDEKSTSQVAIKESTLNNPIVESCLLTEMKKVKFPNPGENKVMEISSFPIKLSKSYSN